MELGTATLATTGNNGFRMSSMNGNYPLHNGTKISTKNRRSVPLRSTIFKMELVSFRSLTNWN